MPSPPYPVSGICYKPNGSTVLSGATVTAYNETTGEALATNMQATTNSLGEYTIDLANFPSGYSNNDAFAIEATSGHKVAQYRSTVNTNNGFENKNLTTSYFDVLGLLIDLLSDNWRQSLTAVKSPADTTEILLGEIMDFKGPDVRTTGRSLIMLYEMQAIFMPNGFGATTRRMIFPASIDIRTTVSRLHVLRLRNEVDRILGANIVLGSSISGYNLVDNYTGWLDKSDGSAGYWRYIIDVKLEKVNASTTVGGG